MLEQNKHFLRFETHLSSADLPKALECAEFLFESDAEVSLKTEVMRRIHGYWEDFNFIASWFPYIRWRLTRPNPPVDPNLLYRFMNMHPKYLVGCLRELISNSKFYDSVGLAREILQGEFPAEVKQEVREILHHEVQSHDLADFMGLWSHHFIKFLTHTEFGKEYFYFQSFARSFLRESP